MIASDILIFHSAWKNVFVNVMLIEWKKNKVRKIYEQLSKKSEKRMHNSLWK